MRLELDHDGAQLFPQALSPIDLAELRALLPDTSKPGARIYGAPALALWLKNGPVGRIARTLIGEKCRPVRAVLFDKRPESNWALGWHQDRTIAVRKRFDVAGFGHWNRKAGSIHVEPPYGLIERMLTIRVHIDPVASANAPLLIAPGSHRMGRIAEGRIEALVRQLGTFACLADAGDVWVYRTPILHASNRAREGARRRVLQVDFSADVLPGRLDWLGVGD